MPDPIRLIPAIFAAVGAVFLVIGVVRLRSQIAFRRRAVRCQGVVTEYRERWSHGAGDSSGQTLYHPVLQFRTADGREVLTESRIGTSWRSVRPGDQVTVTYDPREPQHAYPGRGTLGLVLALVFVGFGVVFGGGGLIGLVAIAALAR